MTNPRRKPDRMAWFKMDAGAFLADTTGLPSSHVGIYAKLICLYWTSGNQLPDNEAILKRKLLVTTPEDEAALQAVLAEFFPDGRHHGLDNQLDEVRATSQMQSEKAKARHTAKPEPKPAYSDEDF